jgi:hypothetical protein
MPLTDLTNPRTGPEVEGLSQAFIEVYETHHGPLVLSLAATPTVYKRNDVVRGDAFNREDDGIDFDVVMELVFPDRDGFVAWIRSLSVEAIGTDDQKFLDRPKTRAYVIEEHVTAERASSSCSRLSAAEVRRHTRESLTGLASRRHPR